MATTTLAKQTSLWTMPQSCMCCNAEATSHAIPRAISADKTHSESLRQHTRVLKYGRAIRALGWIWPSPFRGIGSNGAPAREDPLVLNHAALREKPARNGFKAGCQCQVAPPMTVQCSQNTTPTPEPHPQTSPTHLSAQNIGPHITDRITRIYHRNQMCAQTALKGKPRY
jgi:hypothetical protein